MISLSANQFYQQAIYQNDSQIVFEDNIYTKGPTCSNQLREIAKKYCELHKNQDLMTLLVEENEILTIWLEKSVFKPRKEKQTQAAVVVSQPPHLKLPSSPPLQTDFSQSLIKTQTIVRKYRGQTYKVEVPIVDLSRSKPELIYRGQLYKQR